MSYKENVEFFEGRSYRTRTNKKGKIVSMRADIYNETSDSSESLALFISYLTTLAIEHELKYDGLSISIGYYDAIDAIEMMWYSK